MRQFRDRLGSESASLQYRLELLPLFHSLHAGTLPNVAIVSLLPIASAWIDEHAGVTGAMTAVRDWFTDQGHFSSKRIAIVRGLETERDETAISPC